jgi:hypothetical protein
MKLGCVAILSVIAGMWLGALVVSEQPKDHYSFHTIATEILISVGLYENEVDECLRWAFGDDVEQLEVSMLDDRWRQRHNDLLVIRGSDDLFQSIRRIGKIYLFMKPSIEGEKK